MLVQTTYKIKDLYILGLDCAPRGYSGPIEASLCTGQIQNAPSSAVAAE
jgi:hypothetical protein